MQSTKLVHEALWISKVKVIPWPLSKVTQIQHFKTYFPNKILVRLKPNFILSLHGILGWKFIQMFRVTWPWWLPGPYVIKTLKHHLLRNQEADELETWYTASGTQVLPNLFSDDIGLTLPILWHSQICLYSIWSCISNVILIQHIRCRSGERYGIWPSGSNKRPLSRINAPPNFCHWKIWWSNATKDDFRTLKFCIFAHIFPQERQFSDSLIVPRAFIRINAVCKQCRLWFDATLGPYSLSRTLC